MKFVHLIQHSVPRTSHFSCLKFILLCSLNQPSFNCACATHSITQISNMAHIEESWGRKVKASWWASIASAFIIFACRLWLFWNRIGLEYFQGSYTSELIALRHQGTTTPCHPQASPSMMLRLLGGNTRKYICDLRQVSALTYLSP